jgi:hypothetical protein
MSQVTSRNWTPAIINVHLQPVNLLTEISGASVIKYITEFSMKATFSKSALWGGKSVNKLKLKLSIISYKKDFCMLSNQTTHNMSDAM